MKTPTPPPPTPKLTPAQKAEARLYVLAVNLSAAKAKEAGAKANRIAIEEQIAKAIPGPEAGQVTQAIKDGSKLVVTRGFSYKADFVGIDAVCRKDGEYIPIKSKTTRELDVKGYEWYRENRPGLFAHIAQHVTVTPKKVSVTLKSA